VRGDKKGKGNPYSITERRVPELQSWFFAVSLQVTRVTNPAVGCHYFPPSPQLSLQSLRGLLPIPLLGEQRHDRCEQFVMSECSLSGRGQGQVSNFYIVDLENFAIASRRYTGDIHNSTVVGLFMTPETMAADSVASWLSAHCLSRIASDYISNFIPSIWLGLVV